MRLEIVLCAVSALVISMVLTGIIRKLALAHGLLDVPNQRSSHAVPTPRGGGVAIVVGASVVVAVLVLLGMLGVAAACSLLVGGFAIALVGFFDDRNRLSAGLRLAVHVAAAAATMFWLGGLPPMQIGADIVTFGWEGYVLGMLGIVWSLNFFNFMDGIDGIAASEAAFITFAGGSIALLTGAAVVQPALAMALGAACLGFLVWNWPPAKIFMGDAGSGYVGYMIAVLALLAGQDNPAAMLVWLILGALFFVDATVTLVRRLARRERAHEAHRSHAYQWLSRRWGSHRRVTMLVIAVNVLWLLPCATAAAFYPHLAARITLAALAPVVMGVMAAGAGRKES